MGWQPGAQSWIFWVCFHPDVLLTLTHSWAHGESMCQGLETQHTHMQAPTCMYSHNQHTELSC